MQNKKKRQQIPRRHDVRCPEWEVTKRTWCFYKIFTSLLKIDFKNSTYNY